jgi:cytochrome d ubiquinol oxidase subunit I
MSDLLAARAHMGTSLAFHIIFASLGVGLPLLLCIAQVLALWRKDATWMSLTLRWTKAFALLFAIGAVSGTILSFEIGCSGRPPPSFPALSSDYPLPWRVTLSE